MENIRYPVIGRQTILPMYVSGLGITEYEYHINRENGLVSHQLLFTKDGAGRLNVDGKAYRLDRGKLFYISPSIPHEYYPDGDKWSTCWVVFRGEYLAQLMQQLGFPPYCVCDMCDTSVLERLFDMLMAADDPVYGSEKSSLLLYEYVLSARRFVVGESTEAAPDSIVGRAVSYIDSNYMQDITLQQLCALSGVSAQHFCRLFRKQMAMRPLEYIARRRISQAKLLLQSTRQSVAEIGLQTGYPDPTYFAAVFRRYEGISPLEYRKRSSSLAI